MTNTVFMKLSFAFAGDKYALLKGSSDALRAFGAG